MSAIFKDCPLKSAIRLRLGVPETAEPDELTGGNIEGYMTAERCFRRIRYHWDTHGRKEATGNA